MGSPRRVILLLVVAMAIAGLLVLRTQERGAAPEATAPAATLAGADGAPGLQTMERIAVHAADTPEVEPAGDRRRGPDRAMESAVSGRVLDRDGRSVEGARVHLEWTRGGGDADLQATATDAAGRFTLEGVLPGRHELRVIADRFEDFVLGEVRVLPGRTLELGDLVLAAFAWSRVVGTITTTRGAPLAGVAVVVREPGRPELRAASDAAGHYVLERVPPGLRRLRLEREHAFVLGCTLEVPAGQTCEADLVVPTGTHFVGGRVEVGGQPATGFVVHCDAGDAADPAAGVDYLERAARVQQDGSFRLDGLLTDAPVQLHFTLERPYTIFESPQVAVDRGDHVFSFPAVASTVTVHGTVRDQGGGVLAGAVITAAMHDAPGSVTDAAGGYRIRVEVSNGSTVQVTAKRAGYRQHALPVSLGRAVHGEVALDFTLHSLARTGTVQGQVTAGEDRPLARALVACFAADFAATTITDSRGRFCFEQVTPGPVTIRVDHADHVAAREARELPIAGELELLLRLQSRARLAQAIEVLGEGDVPAAYAEVSVHAAGAFVAAQQTDAFGRARFAGLPAAEVVFAIEPPGHPRHEFRLLPTEDSGPRTLRLQRGLHRIAGTVVDVEAQARRDVDVLLYGAASGGICVAGIGLTDQHGGFAFEHLPAGDYRLEAWSAAGHGSVAARSGELGVRIVLQ